MLQDIINSLTQILFSDKTSHPKDVRFNRMAPKVTSFINIHFI